MDTASTSSSTQKDNSPITAESTHHWVVDSLVVLALVATGGGTYLWQHSRYTAEVKLASATSSKLTVANKKLTSATALVTDLTKQVETLNTKNKQLGSQLATSSMSSDVITPTPAPTPAKLDLAVKGAEYVNPDGTVTQGGKWFGVDFTLTNNTSGAISVSDNDFQLKDTQGNLYPEETTVGASTLPTGWVSLNNPTVAPGETVKGTITFLMPNTTTKNFIFIYGTGTYPVTSAN